MAALHTKVKHALNEGRILILGTQVLVGFQYRATLEPGFDHLPTVSQQLKIAGLGALLVTLGLLLMPPAYHHIVEGGHDSPRLHRVVSNLMAAALLPLCAALGIDVYVVTARQLAEGAGIGLGLGTVAVALACWFGLPLIARTQGGGRHPDDGDGTAQQSPTELEDRIEHVLTEARMVLPGVQALLGFQFAAVLLDGFDRLPTSSQRLHLAGLGLMALATILLMTPAAYHRIVEGGADTERFHRFAARMILLAMVPLALGLSADVVVVVRKVTASLPASLASGFTALAVFYGLWFGVSWWYRWRQPASRVTGLRRAA
jgi:hypothetical protein